MFERCGSFCRFNTMSPFLLIVFSSQPFSFGAKPERSGWPLAVEPQISRAEWKPAIWTGEPHLEERPPETPAPTGRPAFPLIAENPHPAPPTCFVLGPPLVPSCSSSFFSCVVVVFIGVVFIITITFMLRKRGREGERDVGSERATKEDTATSSLDLSCVVRASSSSLPAASSVPEFHKKVF